ncbi:heterokaryon incompatibility protein-domain-containing protein [Xylariaceae sp. AK1471]|nr:heterokaryon incompatibility protein-domain-containing protein [Xylariaceae sp. AK1471]
MPYSSLQSEDARRQHLRMSSSHNYCPPCRRDFSSLHAKQQHMRKSPRHHVCPDCSFVREFAMQSDLEQHRVDVHNLCTECQLIFQTPSWLARHRVLAHQVCGQCRVFFSTSEALQYHFASGCSVTGASRRAMTDDLEDSLPKIRAHYQQPLVTLLLDIQKTEMQHLKSAEFMQNLECLYFSTQSDAPRKSARLTKHEDVHQSTTLKRKRINAFDKRGKDYVAISYTWSHPLPLVQPYGKYSVQSRNGISLPSDVRDSVFERVRKYMDRFNLRYLWIDRHCIVQEESEKKNTAVQAMDLVYSCSNYPIGLLYQPILSMAELKLLTGLITWRKSVVKYGLESKNSSALPRQSPRKTLELLEAIVSDMWWTRAWTYQENYRAGTNMKLLIPHCISSEEFPDDYSDDYVEISKDLPGEILLNSTRFHEVATAFCLAFQPLDNDLLEAKKLVLERARKYTLLLQESDCDLARRSMSPSIIADIEKRQLSIPFDRLPIIANCCQYSIRLDGTELAKRGHSLSLTILALFLLNGEILYNRLDHRTGVSNTLNITGVLDKKSFRQYSPPRSAHGLTYNKSCRFIDVKLTRRGIKTRGHLWKLGRVIHTSDFPKTLPFVKDNRSLQLDDQRRLMLLANEIELQHSNLSEDIRKYLDYGNTSKYTNSFAKYYQRYMAEELAAAIRQEGDIQLASLHDPSGRHNPYRGIFICNSSGQERAPEYVFTASREKAAGNDNSLTNDTDRHVSIEVDYRDGAGELPFLRTRRWIHGLCFFYDCERKEVIFPWPSTVQI